LTDLYPFANVFLTRHQKEKIMSNYLYFTVDEMFMAVREGRVSFCDFEDWMINHERDQYSDGYDAGYYNGSAAY
jgi:hypothetical protein